jgi:hypothetical protein
LASVRFDNATVTAADPFSSSPISIIPAVLGVVLLVFFGLVLLVGVFVIVVVANRAEPDPSGRRPLALYLFGVSFFSVFAALFASFVIVLGLVQLIGSHQGRPSGSLHPVGDAVARIDVLGGLILLVAVALLITHLRPGLTLSTGAGQGGSSPLNRVAQSYLAAVSFISVLIFAASIVFILWEVFRILGPGVFELSETRVAAARSLLAAAYLAIATATLVVTHRRILGPGAASAGLTTASTAPVGPSPVPSPAPPPTTS